MSQKSSEEMKIANIPEILPVLPLSGAFVFPKMLFPLEVSGASAISLIDEAMAGDRLIGLVMLKQAGDPTEGPHKMEDFYGVGTSVVILRMAKTADNKTQLLLQGIGRFRIVELLEGKPYLRARVENLEDREAKDIEVEALMANLVGLFERIVKLSPFLPQEFGAMAKTVSEPGVLSDIIASVINAPIEEKQKLLEILDVKERLREVTRLVNHQVEILELGSKIQTQVKDDMDKSQREYYLRQQLSAIRKELGETDDEKVEVEEYRAKIEKKNLPEEAKKEAERELARLSKMHPSSAEYTVAATYLDWMTALPWNEGTEDNLDIKKARRVLDEDHYGLEKAKKRIIEYLAVRKLKPDSKGPILCLVRPPGDGQDLPRPLHRPRAGTEVHPHLARRHPRRGGDPRPPADLRRGAARPDHPGNPAGGVQQPRLHAGRDRQGRERFPRRSLVGAPGGPRPGAEFLLRGPLPGRPVRPVACDVHHDGQQPGDDPAGAPRPPGGDRAARLHDRRKDPDRPALPDPAADGGKRPETGADPDHEEHDQPDHHRLHPGGGGAEPRTGDRLGLPGGGQPDRGRRDREGVRSRRGISTGSSAPSGSPRRRPPGPRNRGSSWGSPGRRPAGMSSSSRRRP